MKQRTRLTALLLAAILLLQCLPVNAFASVSDLLGTVRAGLMPDAAAEDFSWSIDGTVLTVTGTGAMPDWGYYSYSPWYDQRLELTEIHVAEGLTSIGGYAFKDARNVTKVILPDTLTSIGSSAFAFCRSLPEITIPEGVTGIGDEVFDTCEALVRVTLPETLTSIGRIAFANCDALESVVVPDSVTTMGVGVFASCNKLKNVTLPAGLTALPNETFLECGALETAVLPDPITSIGYRAFYRCGSLTEVTIPAAVVSIGNEAFRDCTGLAAVTLGDGLTSIGDRSFSNCTSLAQIDLPEGLQTIGASGFGNCTALTEIIVPDSVHTIQSYAFESCSSLRTVKLPRGLSQISSYLFRSSTALQTLEIPDTVTSIGDGAFSACYGLQEIVIPDSVTVLGTSVFNACRGLTEVTLSASLTEIPMDTFYNCESLSAIVIPEGVTAIGIRALYSCDALTTVVLPQSLREIRNGAFDGSGLTALSLPDGLETIGNEAFKNCDGLTELVIPGSVTSIGSWAFHLMDGITSMTIPDSVTTMGDNVFNGCANLAQVHLGSGITGIPAETFRTCPSLATLDIPSNVTFIGQYAFRGSGIAELTIPETVTEIQQFAFYQCKALEQIVIPDTVTSLGRSAFYDSGVKHAVLGSGVTEIPNGLFEYTRTLESVTIPEGITSIGSYAFRDCNSLTELSLPSTLTDINDGAFTECDTITEAVIPDGVTKIPPIAFYGCDNLQTVLLPDGIVSIGDNAFCRCTSLTDIVLPDGLTSIGRAAFSRASALPKIVIPDSVTHMDIEAFDSCTALAEAVLSQGLTRVSDCTFRNCSALDSIELPASVTGIGREAFLNTGLTAIDLHENVAEIGESAFNGAALESLTIPATVTSLGQRAFSNNRSLKKLVVEEGITALAGDIFNGCPSLTDVFLPEGLLTINEGAFQNCSSLRQIDFPDTLTSIGHWAFYHCTALESIRLPDTLTTLGSQAFRDCISLSSVKLNEGLARLESNTFYHCSALTDIVLPKTVTFIDSDAFGECPNLEWIWIAPAVTSIHGNAFRNWKNLTIGGIQGSYAEVYAKEYGIPFVHALTPGVRLKLKLTDPEGNPITGEYTVNWYLEGTDEPIATGTTLHAEDLEMGYSYQVLLGRQLGMQYIQPQRQKVPADAAGTLSLALVPIAKRTLSGRVLDTQGNGLKADLTLTQSYPGGGTGELTVQTDDTGSYTLTIDNVRTEATIRANGYFSTQQFLVGGPVDSDSITAADVTLYPLPEGNRIDLTFRTSSAVREGGEPQTGSHSGAGLVFAVFNATRNYAMDPPAFENGKLYFNGSQVREGDELVISAVDPSGVYQVQEFRVTLDASHIGSGQMTLVENGSIRIESFLGCSSVRLMLFDEAGTLRNVSSVSGSYHSPILPDGSYRLVLLEENDYIRSAAGIDTLESLGLTAGRDYALLTAQVRSGVVTVLPNPQVPPLNTAGLCNTDPAKTSLHLIPGNTPVGQYVQVRLAYSLKEGVASDGETIQFTLPGDVVLYEGAVYLGDRNISYRQEGNVITVETGLAEAVLYFYVMPRATGSHSITSSLHYTADGVQRREPLGSITLTVEDASITVPERTKRKTFNVTGKALPGSTVRIYAGQTLLGETTVNAAGTWNAAVSPVNLFNIQVHDIHAVIEHEDLPEPVVTSVASTLYDMWYVELERVLMHTGRTTVVFDYTNPGPAVPYTETGNYTFELEFDGDSSQLHAVFLTVYCLSGRTVTVPVQYLEDSGKWVAAVDLLARDAPVNVGVSYRCDYGPDYGVGLGWTEEGLEIARRDLDLLDRYLESTVHVNRAQSMARNTDKDEDEEEDEYYVTWENITDVIVIVVRPGNRPGTTTPIYVEIPGQSEPVEVRLTIDSGGGFVIETTDPHTGQSVTISIPTQFIPPNAPVSPEINFPKLGNDLSWMMDLFPGMDWVDAGKGCMALLDLYEQIRLREKLRTDLLKRLNDLYDDINAVCPDGSMKYDPITRSQMQEKADDLYEIANAFDRGHREDLQKYADQIRNNFLYQLGGNILGKLVDKLPEDTAFGINAALAYIKDQTNLQTRLNADIPDFDFDEFKLTNTSINNRLTGGYQEIDRLFDNISPEIALGSVPNCDDRQDPAPPGPFPKVTPIIDPAGFIYEAVESNRIEGATVTVYYKDKKGTAVKWDAENYDQINPLTTDENGAYAWFVPMGMWQVKCEMPGYRTVYSEWLPVPPPQMEVNLGLISTEAPEVETIEIFETGAVIAFSQYMDIDSVREAVSLSVGTAEAVPLDAEPAPDGVTRYATRFQVSIPEGTTESVQVLVSGSAKNYAGTPIAAAHASEPAVPVAAPTEVNMREEYVLVIGQELNVNVTLLPGLAGRTLDLQIHTPQFLTAAENQVITDASGNATFRLNGLLPGEASITVREPGSGLSATARVHIRTTEAAPVDEVTVILENGTPAMQNQTVTEGTKLIFTTDTAGARIHYTLDGTCPCRSGALVYTEPLVLTEDTHLLVAAVVDGVFGPITEYRFTVEAHRHSFTNYVSDGNATCTADGTKTAKCDHCDATDTVPDTGSALGHDFGPWTLVQAPTTAQEGLEERTCTRCGHVQQQSIAKLENPFTDVAPGVFYFEPVMWAIENSITNGTSSTTFGPDDQCMRAHVVTFLWRAVGSPEPTRTDNPFVDVQPTDFYYKPVLWALENGITSGMDSTHFGPTAYCNRAQVVTFLYRTMGSPELETARNPFKDVAAGSFYEKPVLWAVKNGITNGLSSSAFGPDTICNRAQIVTFLYRAFVNP